jgi:hypothetical protein
MNGLPVEILENIMIRGSLSVYARVNKLFNEICSNIQSRCKNTNCIDISHPKCCLLRPWLIANIAVSLDLKYLLKVLRANYPHMWRKISYYCLQRWDVYRGVVKYITGKRYLTPSVPFNNNDFTASCHQGRKVLRVVATKPLPLRGLAAQHARRCNRNVKLITFNPHNTTNNGRVVDITAQFHDHQFDTIKDLMMSSTVNSKARINHLDAHLGICKNIVTCNCVKICEWLMEFGFMDQKEMISYYSLVSTINWLLAD